MATTLQQLAQFLDHRQWRYRVDPAESHILTGVKAEHVDPFVMVLRLSEQGEFLQFQAPQILMVSDSVYKGLLLQTMAHIQYQVKMLRLEYDPTDSRILASIELPLEDAPLTDRQFNRCLEGLVHLVDQEAMPRLKAVLATGEDPGRRALAQRLMADIPTELMGLLEEMVNLHQQQRLADER